MPELIEQIKVQFSPFKLQCLQNILLQTRIPTKNGLDVPRKVLFYRPPFLLDRRRQKPQSTQTTFHLTEFTTPKYSN
jgi:hypothetical protein